jgi:hypothetical protein
MTKIPAVQMEFSLENLPAGSLTPVSLKLPVSLTYEQWAQLGPRFHAIHRRLAWYVGDWINFGEQRFGEKYAQAVDDTGYDPGYLANVSWVCRAVEAPRRREDLTFGHHQEVAGLTPSDQEKWLLRAEEEKWTRDELRDRLKKKSKKKKKGGDDATEADPGAEWWRLTRQLVGPKNWKDVERALARGLEVYEVESHPLVVAHWANEALARWAKEPK